MNRTARRRPPLDSRTAVVDAQRKQELTERRNAELHTTPADLRADIAAKLTRFDSTSTETQCDRVLAILRAGPATTHELRALADVQAPAARISELKRRHGHQIDSRLVLQVTVGGRLHRFARYYLVDEG